MTDPQGIRAVYAEYLEGRITFDRVISEADKFLAAFEAARDREEHQDAGMGLEAVDPPREALG
jgi:hypothetical protein